MRVPVILEPSQYVDFVFGVGSFLPGSDYLESKFRMWCHNILPFGDMRIRMKTDERDEELTAVMLKA